MELTQNHLDNALKEHKNIVEIYKEKYTTENKRDWRTYEQRLAMRIKTASKELETIVEEAYSRINVSKPGKGRPLKIPVTNKVTILLLKDIFQLSNRKMANFLTFFTILTDIDISYKTVERTYSDEPGKTHNTQYIPDFSEKQEYKESRHNRRWDRLLTNNNKTLPKRKGKRT